MTDMLERVQVKPTGKEWSDKGPDMLRKRDNAWRAINRSLRWRSGWWVRKSIKGGWSDWKGPFLRSGVEEAYHDWNSDEFQIGRRMLGKVRVRIRARAISIHVVDYPDASPAANITAALMLAGTAGTTFAGIFACKDVENHMPPWPGVQPSNHAWGDAVDITGNTTVVTDYAIRMAKEDQIPIVQVLGTLDGRSVINASDDTNWQIRLGGADSSHLWHCHMDNHIHSGTPPCAR